MDPMATVTEAKTVFGKDTVYGPKHLEEVA